MKSTLSAPVAASAVSSTSASHASATSADSATIASNADVSDIIVRHPDARRSRRVFITRRDREKVLEHVREFVAAAGRFEPVIASERVATGGPLLCDLIEQMRGCDTAIVHVTADAATADADRQPRIGGDVLIEIGAAMALYGREFVLLVEDGIELPQYLHGLCECRYGGEVSNMAAMIRWLRAFGGVTRGRSGRPSAAAGATSAFGYPQQAEEAAAKH